MPLGPGMTRLGYDQFLYTGMPLYPGGKMPIKGRHQFVSKSFPVAILLDVILYDTYFFLDNKDYRDVRDVPALKIIVKDITMRANPRFMNPQFFVTRGPKEFSQQGAPWIKEVFQAFFYSFHQFFRAVGQYQLRSRAWSISLKVVVYQWIQLRSRHGIFRYPHTNNMLSAKSYRRNAVVPKQTYCRDFKALSVLAHILGALLLAAQIEQPLQI